MTTTKHPVLKNIWVRENGNLSSWPATKEEAVRCKVSKYGNGSLCEECGYEYIGCVVTDHCMWCQRLKINYAYWMRDHSEMTPLDPHMAIPKKQVNWFDEMKPYIERLRAGEQLAEKPCKHGHIYFKGTLPGCTICRKYSSPRALAEHHSKEWYLPHTPCTSCEAITFRNVADGSCKECDSGGSITESLMRDNPDMILSKSDALMLGFKVYRTGKACRNGHTGYRWTANSGCIECMKK